MKGIENPHAQSIAECLRRLESTVNGLSAVDAENRLQKFGANRIMKDKRPSRLLTFFRQFTDLMVIILLIAAGISIVVSIVNAELRELIDGIVIMCIVLVNAILSFVQEIKAEKSLEALKKMTVKECKVIRGGQMMVIPAEQLVVGDMVSLDAGDIVPADLRLVQSAHLKCDESSLTGESNSIEKHIEEVDDKAALGDRVNMAFSGTVCVYGRGLGVVVATGKKSQMGKIAEMLHEERKTLSPLQENMKSLGKIVTIIVLLIAAVVFALEVLKHPQNGILPAFLTAVAIAVAAIPESMPAVVTIIMAMGVSRLAKRKAIVKKINAVETLGCCEVICSDKTGTLTQNKMVVQEVFCNGNFCSGGCKSSAEFSLLLRTMVLCNNSLDSSAEEFWGDPTETALCDYAKKYGISRKEFVKRYPRIDEIPFDSTRKTMTTYHQVDGAIHTFTKGGVDEILARCSKIYSGGKMVELTDSIRENILNSNRVLAEKALRTLAFAHFSRQSEKNELVFIGIAGMIDPPRPEVKEAVENCRKAGIMPIMITGDHKDTALSVAREIGIASHKKEVITGAELDRLTDKQFYQQLWKIKVYARVTPENKVRIVKAFREQGKIVGMTGDGVNDAPSIKAASIGIGMGITGTDVSKDAADIILADDNFATIIVAVEEGRRIYKNIEKTVKYLFSANIAEVLSVLITTLFFPSFAFLSAVQILFVNIITDSVPAIALGLELPERELMHERPRPQSQKLFSRKNLMDIGVMAVMQTALVITSFVLGLTLTANNAVASTMAFVTLNAVQLVFIFNSRVNGNAFKSNPLKNKWVIAACLFGGAILSVLLLTPARSLVNGAVLSAAQWGIALGLSLVVFPLGELYKYLRCKLVKRCE